MVKDSDSFLIYQSIVCISLWCLLTSQKQPWSIFCCRCSTKMFFLYSKTMFLHPSANIHQRVKLGACVWCKGVAAFYFKKPPFVCAREPCMHVCVCAWVQKAPIGMNYLAESLLYLSMVDWPRACTVLLPTTQETTLIHHPAFCSMPLSHPTTPPQFSQACWSGPLQMSLFRSLQLSGQNPCN